MLSPQEPTTKKQRTMAPLEFIPLKKLLTFFTLDILKTPQKRFKPEAYAHFFQSEHLAKEIDDYLATLHPAIDQSLEGDIYSQNEKRTRSIVEEISNSIDAKPEAIHCTIRDGYYEIREIQGDGMSPEIICTKYLPPKASTKTNSEKQIGRFGIGSFTKLAHLNAQDASVIVETRARGQIGCRLEYRKINGELCVAMSADPNITEYGTVTKVTSTEITAADYETMLRENIGDDSKTPIYINQKLFVPNAQNHQASISINDIRITRKIQDEESFTTKVNWNLPHGTTISESRNKILLDNEKTLKVLQSYVDALKAMPSPDWIKYANTIAPLVADIQATNSSMLASDNILDYLINVTREKLNGSPCVPDLPIYKPLLVDGVWPLHPILVPEDWAKHVAVPALEWSLEGTEVIVAPLANYPDDEPFIHDKDHNRVILAEDYYQKLKSENNLDALDLIFKYPPGEINAERYVGGSTNLKLLKPNVTFKTELMQNPLHTLYQRHGMLWVYGDAATKEIIQQRSDAEAILKQAKSLIAVYPIQIFRSYPNSDYNEHVGHPLAAIKFQGKQYYYNEKQLFDDRFQVLFDKQYDLLKAKIEQVIEKMGFRRSEQLDTLTLDISLSADDVLAVESKDPKKTYRIKNGLGEIIPLELNNSFLRCTPLDDDYHIIGESKKGFSIDTTYLYQRSTNHLEKIANEFLIWQPLPNNTDIITGLTYNNEIRSLYSRTKQKIISPKCKEVLASGNFFLGVIGEYSFERELVLFDQNGEVIYRFDREELEDILLNDVVYFDCVQVGNDYNVSLLTKSHEVHFFQINKPTPQCTGTSQYFEPEKTIGFPVIALTSALPSMMSSITPGFFKNLPLPTSLRGKTRITPLYQEDPPIDVVLPQNYRNLSTRHYISFSDSSEKKPLPYYYDNSTPLIVESNGQRAFLSKENLSLTPLNLSWGLNEIEEIKEFKGHYYIDHVNKHKKNIKLNAVIDQQGHYLGEGYHTRVIKTDFGDCLYADGYVYTPQGKKINAEKIQYAKSFHTEDHKLIEVSYKHKDSEGRNHYSYAIFDGQGVLQFTDEKLDYPSQDEKGYYRLNWDKLHTPYGTVAGARLRSSNNHPTKAIDDLIVTASQNQEYTFTRAGYPFFNHVLPEYHDLLRQHIFIARKSQYFDQAIYKPLTQEDLLDPQVLDNLSYLNQLKLNIFKYSSALRFIHWPNEALQRLIPYINLLTFTPTIEAASDYLTLINFAEKLSEKDRTLLIKLFDLIYGTAHEQLVEPIAQKLINVVEIYGFLGLSELYDSLQKQRYKLALHPTFEKWRPIIEEMPNTAAQICFYLLYPEKQLLAQQKEASFKPLQNANRISLMDFMIAYQFDTPLLDILLNDPEQFIQQISTRAAESDKSHPLRLLQHAIYYQADPNKHLYERELLQNALDAYAAAGRKGQDAPITVDLYREGDHCIFRMRDQAIGMSLKDIFYYYVLLGTSSKREDRHERFIGGHGIGAFTIYHNASLVRLKTGQNNGNVYCFEFRPIYDAQDKIIDIEVKWERQAGNFQGVEVERVARSNRPTLDAARHHRTFKMHGKTVNADVADITLNNKPINQSMKPLASIEVPELGFITLYQSIDDMVTAGGLSVRPVNNLDRFIPEELRKTLRAAGLIIDLPKKIPLNRERTEVIDADHVYAYLKPYLLQAYIEAYMRVFMQDNMALTELPYDFFANFESYLRGMEINNPTIVDDANDILHNKSLNNYQKYQSMKNFHELMALLPIFKTDLNQKFVTNYEPDKETYTLVELAKYYRKHSSFPPLKQFPLCLKFFADRYDQEQRAKVSQKQASIELNNFPQIDWIPRHYQDVPYWHALAKISEYLTKCFGFDMRIGFSTCHYGDLLHTRRHTNIIYWNVYALQNEHAETLIHELSKHNGGVSQLVDDLLDKISHELVHAQLEEDCGSTHNRSFSIKQRKLLIELSKKFDKRTLIENIQKIYDECVPNSSSTKAYLDWKLLLNTQFLNDKNSESSRELFGLFGANPYPQPVPPAGPDPMEIDDNSPAQKFTTP